ncbi:MAG: amino acid adenylation domain-containing protein, partial [Caulobacteraceae bacterium]
TDYPRPGIQRFEGESVSFRLEKDLTEKLKKVCKANGATLYMILLSAYNILLSRYSGQEDIIIGSAAAGRPHADLHNMVGVFVNTLAMRSYPEGNKTFNEFLQEVKNNALSAYENQDYQFEKLVERLDIRKDLSRNALFDTMFILQNTENKEIQLDNVRIKQFQFERGVSKFDITLEAEEKGEEIKFDLEYCSKLFKRATIERMIGHFKNILKETSENPEIKLCEINMLSEEEKRKILAGFNNTKAQYPKDKTICEVFEEQVKKAPDNIAVVYEGEKLTYGELNEKANSLAGSLREKGVTADSIVGIMVERSLEMMVGIVGILKAGGAYLPISPDYPDDRIKYMLEDSKAAIVLTQKHLLDTMKFDGIAIDLEDNKLYQGNKTNLEIVNNPNNLAYVIYTSGSTGKPKGVMIQHGSVINLVTGLGKIIYDKYIAPLNVALIAPYVFDASVKQIFASILRGNCLYIIPEEYRTIGEKLVEYYIDNSIDISDGTPSHFKLMLSDNREKIKDMPVKHFIIGGEELSVNVVKDFLAFFKDRKPDITNIYGPTECCVDSTAFLIDSDRLDKLNTIPIGRPLVNYSVYVLNNYNKLQPAGVAGELCIAGAGLARGYLNKPELTEEKFAANPFDPGKKMYKTGDLVRWLSDGNIEFLGRIDHQVKIRGYRIEIGEIEALIKSHPSVKDSVVIVRKDNTAEKRLIAYIVSKTNNDDKYSEASLREHLKKNLPKYMIPAVFVQLEKIPLNANGKVDRFALPEPDMLQRDSNEGYIAPRNKEEIEMAELWAKILGTPEIGIDDDFFDLGGDSFKAIRLVRSINGSLGVMELFKNSTIRELAAYLSKDSSNKRTMLHELTKPIDEKNKAASLICFPYGGGSAISFQPLANALPKNYSLYAVELPGHDYSCPDEELASIEESASRCFEEIKQNVKGPIVLYGHCLGATMAALVAYKLEEAGIQLDGVFVGAMFPNPRISNKFFNIWDKIFPSQLTDKGNRDMLKTIGGLNSGISSAETEFILRNLKHDSKECIRWYTQFYNSKERAKLKAPITCVIGEGDRATEFYQERYKEWEHFSENVDLKPIKQAGHFFFKNQAAELTEIIKEKVDLWQGRSSTAAEIKKMDERKENAAELRTPAKKQVSPSMNLFLIVAIVQIISEIGTILSTFGTGIWVFKQTNVLSQFAMMFLLGVLPTILILPISGVIVDRFDRRLILIASDILSAICSFSLLALLYNNGLQIWQVYIYTIAASVAICFRQPAYMAAITQITPKMYLPQANSVSQFSVAIGGILASICGGVFMDSIGFKGLVAIDFATFVISLVTLAFLRFPDTMFKRLEEPILKELMGGWNFIIKRKSLVVMVIFFLITNFLVSIFDVTMTPLILSFTNPSVLGVINAFSGIGVLCGAMAMLITGGLKKRAKGMVGFVAPLAVSMIIAGTRPLPAFAAIALFGASLSVTIVNIHWQSLIQVKVGLELQGRVFAINRMMVAVLTPVSYITAGILADRVFSPIMEYGIFNSPIVDLILGIGAGRGMRLNLLIAGAVLFVWSIMGLRYKQLVEMDDILEDAIPGEIIIKDKDKLQQLIDGKIKAGLYS